MTDLQLHITSVLGLLLGVSLIAGLLAESLHLPKVTAYLIVGIVLGPQVYDIIPHNHVDAFKPMLKLAMSLVLFNLGTQFVFKKIRTILGRTLFLAGGEFLGTILLVTGGLLLFQVKFDMAILLACLALATAPATTVLVLKELQSEGPVTNKAGILVALNNFGSVVSFEVAFLIIQAVAGTLEGSMFSEAGKIVLQIGGSILLGGLAGLTLSYSCGLLRKSRWLVLLVAVSTFLLGICLSFDVPYLLTFLAMGATVANTSDSADTIREELDHITGLLCVLFFAVHGAELELDSFVSAGLIGAIYIISRMAGKYFGVFIAAKLTRQTPEVKRWLGATMMAQAGAAISLAAIAVERNPTLGEPIQTVILGSVVIFELIGPLMIRQALLRAGEVPISQAISHTSNTPQGQLIKLADRLSMLYQRKRSSDVPPQEVQVASLMRKQPGILESAVFADVLSHIEHSHDNTYPVVDPKSILVGVIRYPHLSNVMFEHNVNDLVCAEDLATPARSLLHPDDTLEAAFDMFQKEKDDCIPVVEREEPQQLVGVIRRSDVTRAMIRQRNS